MPLKSIENHTPYFKLFNELLDFSLLRTFGCICYYSTSKFSRTKFDSRANSGVFVGYPVHTKGYKVLDLDTRQIVISRDVVFHEHHFPFHLAVNTDSFHSFSSAIYLPTVTDISSPNTTVFDSTSYDDVSKNSEFSSSPSNPDHLSPSFSTYVSNLVDLSPPVIQQPTRKSNRISSKPTYLTDFICNTAPDSYATSQSHNHWCNLVRYDSLPYKSQSFIAKVCEIQEPANFTEASQYPLWLEAMAKEIDALNSNHTWDLTDLPPEKRAIGSKWVFKVKLKSDGSLERCKARLVAKDFNQRYGVDYEETFSPVVKMSKIRCLLSLAASRKWSLYQLDINNAFLHGDLFEEVYMKVPDGISYPFNKVCKLRKSIYGLKQASREWFAKLLVRLKNQDFIQSKNDYSLFIRKSERLICIAAVYVDDIILTVTHTKGILNLKAHLHHQFGIKDLSLLNYFLGIEVSYLTDGIFLSHKKFTNELLSECGQDLSHKAFTQLPLHVKLTASEGELISQPELYRSMVRKLNFLTNTRSDLAYAVQSLSQFMQKPRTSHFSALIHTLRYVNHTIGQGILLKADTNITLQVFSDSDWAACMDSRRSVTGYVLLLGSSTVTWKSKKQSIVSRSSSEAEYRALASTASEIMWLVHLLE